MPRQNMSTEDIIGIWDEIQNTGKSKSKIARKYKVKMSDVYSVERTMKKYLFQFNTINAKRSTYVNARDIIMNREVTEIVDSLPRVTATEDGLLEKLERDLKAIRDKEGQVISEFILSMVDLKTAKIKEENAELRKVTEAARKSNIFFHLKQRFMGK